MSGSWEWLADLADVLPVMAVGVVAALIAWTLADRLGEVATRRLPAPMGGVVAGAIRGALMVGSYALVVAMNGAMHAVVVAGISVALVAVVPAALLRCRPTPTEGSIRGNSSVGVVS